MARGSGLERSGVRYMYNKDLKCEFIQQYTQSATAIQTCEAVFNVFEKYEEEMGADLCTLSVEQLQPIIDKALGNRIRGRMSKYAILKKYVEWCVSAGVEDATDNILKIDISGTEKMRMCSVANPLGLQLYCDSIFKPENKESIDNIYRCFLWLGYAGMLEQDIMNITVDDVDLSNMVVKYNGESYPIYSYALPAIKNCVMLKSFVYEHGGYKSAIYKRRVEGDKLIRGITGTYSLSTIRSEITRKSIKAGHENKHMPRLSYKRVFISGLFYRTFEREKAGIPVDFSDAVNKFVLGKKYDFSSGKSNMKLKKSQILHDFEVDYERWKKAFSL